MVFSIVGPPVSYDGSDESLIPTIRLLSGTGVAVTTPRFYDIPCDVLVRRPGLLEATLPMFGSNLDNFLPRSGCGSRGHIDGFPEEALRTYRLSTLLADGNYLATRFAGMSRSMLKM